MPIPLKNKSGNPVRGAADITLSDDAKYLFLASSAFNYPFSRRTTEQLEKITRLISLYAVIFQEHAWTGDLNNWLPCAFAK
jgi:hypothetical protein